MCYLVVGVCCGGLLAWCWCWARPVFGWSAVSGVPLVAGRRGVGDGVGEGAAGGAAADVGAAGVALVDGGVLPAGVGPRHSWWRYPWVSLACVLAPLVLLMPMVSYRPVLPWRLPLMLWFVGAEAVLPVSVSVMSVVRSLWVSLWFSASRTLPMLVVVGVGLCVGGPWLAFRAVVGFCGSVWGGVQ